MPAACRTTAVRRDAWLAVAAVEQRGAEGQVAVAGGGGEEGFALAQGDEQQVGGAGLAPEHGAAPQGLVSGLSSRKPASGWVEKVSIEST